MSWSTVSFGVNLSVTDWNWTLLRAETGDGQNCEDAGTAAGLTLDQSRHALGHVPQDDLPAPVLQEAVQRRRFFILVDGIAHLGHSASASIE